MKLILLLMTSVYLFSGCAGKFVGHELKEAKLTKISINAKVPLHVKGNINFAGAISTIESDADRVNLVGDQILPLYHVTVKRVNFNEALLKSIKLSDYFNKSQSRENKKSLKVSLSKGKWHFYWKGFSGYMATLATVPFALDGQDFICKFEVLDSNGSLLKEYKYLERVESSLTVWTPAAIFIGENKSDIVQSLMDKYVSNFIKDVEKDKLFQYTDSNKI